MGGEIAMEWQNAKQKADKLEKDNPKDIAAEPAKIQPPKIKYEFENEGQYLVAKYKEQLDFALYQVMSQYQSAKKREDEEKKDVKTFGITLLAIILILPLGVLMAISGGMMFTKLGFVFGLLGCLIVLADIPFLLYALPLCLYKVMRGFVLMQINKQSRFGLWICKKWNIEVFSSESRQCENYIRKYRLILQELEELRSDLEFTDTVDLQPIKERMANVDTKPNIRVVNSLYGIVNEKIRKASIVVTVLVYILLAVVFFRFYGVILSEINYMMKQM